jgi:hypothetical protein
MRNVPMHFSYPILNLNADVAHFALIRVHSWVDGPVFYSTDQQVEASCQ